jgi:hypothetical protein
VQEVAEPISVAEALEGLPREQLEEQEVLWVVGQAGQLVEEEDLEASVGQKGEDEEGEACQVRMDVFACPAGFEEMGR